MNVKETVIFMLAGLAGTCGFALLFRLRKKLIVWAALGTALTLAVYVICLHTFTNAFYQNLFPALCGALYAEIAARLTKSPSTQYLACAIIPLVPGSGLYRTMYAVAMGHLDVFPTELRQTARTAAGLAVGIIIVSVIVHQIRSHSLIDLFDED